MKAINYDVSLSEFLEILLDQHAKELRVAMPGIVRQYYPETQEVDVQPALQENIIAVTGVEQEPIELPLLAKVPVLFQRSGPFSLTFPVQPGDRVMLIFQDRSIDRWATNPAGGDVTNPQDLRSHHLADAVAIPGLYPQTEPLTSANAETAVLGHDSGLQAHFEQEAMRVKLEGKPEGSVTISEALQTIWTSAKNAFAGHTHPTGTGPSGLTTTTFPDYDATNIPSNHVKVPKNS